ncbi:MAG: dockerin type I repeat-containing protein [Prevotella sp.]|nr:dockerin type I repeat-containing protein [Alistipes senegalensis]MCM1358405.1 dockerin type I repeat-containing protein [Prevotella sp.]MCM1473797.1 dockerin type I repeat-containing protein [Muribaculaceae bacterium]
MKKFLSALMSMTVALSAMPVISNAEDTALAPLEPLPPEALPYSVSDSGDTVIFDGDKSYDYIISSTNTKFTTERNNDSMGFKPEENGKFIVSRVWLEESIIDYSFSTAIDYETGETIYINDPIKTHCHYFYPHIQNFEVTYYSKTGAEVEFLGETTYYNENTVKEIKTKPSAVCYDYMEMNTADILDHSSYYALASSRLLNETGAFFTYYDYGWNDEKDKSLFCVDIGYYANEEMDMPVSVSGNAEITKTLYGGSWIDGNLEIATCDMVPYTLIEPTADGFAEVYSYIVSPMSSTILTIENGRFTDRCSIGCFLPEAGDLNMDYKISIADAVVFEKYILGKTNLTSVQYTIADMNNDGSVDIFDMVLIRQKVIEENHLGLIPEPIDTIQYSGEECGKNPNV